MREHMGLYRGKRIDNGEWVEGFYAHFKDLYKDRETHRIYKRFAESDCGEFYPDYYEVEPDIVGECTGLRDKNGKLIFEGDIIQFHKHRGEPDWVGVVKYEHTSFMVEGTMPLAYSKPINGKAFHCGFDIQISGIDKTTIKVIGNIHDNPELLKGGEG